MTRKTRNTLLIIILIVVLAAGISVGLYLGLRNNDMPYTIKELGKNNLRSQNVEEFTKSKLHLHENNTFDVEIYYLDEKLFIAIGTYTKNKDSYSFTYIDCWMLADDQIVPDNQNLFIGKTVSYSIVDDLIRFEIHSADVYYFGK